MLRKALTSERADLPDSSLRIVLPLECTNLVFLVGGPPSPLYPPNKVIIWDDKLRQAAAELEFREDVRGLAVRRDRLVVVLRRRVIVFVLGRGEAGVWREGGYETADNPKGALGVRLSRIVLRKTLSSVRTDRPRRPRYRARFHPSRLSRSTTGSSPARAAPAPRPRLAAAPPAALA